MRDERKRRPEEAKTRTIYVCLAGSRPFPLSHARIRLIWYNSTSSLRRDLIDNDGPSQGERPVDYAYKGPESRGESIDRTTPHILINSPPLLLVRKRPGKHGEEHRGSPRRLPVIVYGFPLRWSQAVPGDQRGVAASACVRTNGIQAPVEALNGQASSRGSTVLLIILLLGIAMPTM